MDVEELLAVVLGALLASGQEHGPPCHQSSMDNDHMEASSQESPTIISSEPTTLHYAQNEGERKVCLSDFLSVS